MKEKITDEQIIALLEGEQNLELENQIRVNSDLQKRYEELKEVFDAMNDVKEVEVPAHIGANLQEATFQEQLKSQHRNIASWMQIAAAVALLIVGFSAGKYTTSDSSQEFMALKTEIASLRDATLTSSLQRHSASERIMAVNRIEEQPSINMELISTLISTLNSDESPNVRYAALQAVKKFIGNDDVRAELVKSLETQTDPLIQISLITILVEAEERSAIAPLRDIIKQEDITPEVKQQAEVAIQVLT